MEIGSNINGVSLHDAHFDGFWAECERLGTAVFVHGMPAPCDRVPGAATATFGVGVEASLRRRRRSSRAGSRRSIPI